MCFHDNPQLQLAYDFVQYTNKTIFLTGKAGTGKTTFLHNLKKVSPKRMVVVAPTGVAAINAGGVTIHSFFQLHFGPHIPGRKSENAGDSLKENSFQRKFNKEKIHLIQSLDLLVIDEISMVRADMLDAIDEVLRKYKNYSKPFGGVQLLMIGDLHQLSPVIKESEWSILKDYYDTVYFFSSKALQQTMSVSIELMHIYRQSDTYFIGMLNQIRTNQITPQTLTELNQRFIPDFKPKDEEGYIILTTHNANALEINHSKLKTIKHQSIIFDADIFSEFPEYAYPTELNLELKVDAQVMFVKNDSSREKLYYNGKIGKVTRIEDDIVYVKCPDEDFEIPVSKEEWENVKYSLDEQTKEIKETIVGRFTQYPLKLAWAITIHKSQGLTFDKAIIDANASFAHGQVYVALSRCKSFEGLVLSSPISLNSIKTDQTVSIFTNDVRKNSPTEQQLAESKIAYQQSLLFELFDFKKINNRFYYLKKIILENTKILDVSVLEEFNVLETISKNEVYTIADKFKNQLGQLLQENQIPEENKALQERIMKASIYFKNKLEQTLYTFTTNTAIETDNKAVKQSIIEALEKLQKDIFIKINCFKFCINGFETLGFIKIMANAEIDFKSTLKSATPSSKSVSKNIPHPKLYMELKSWRSMIAQGNDTDEFMVLPYKSMVALCTNLPTSLSELETIKGIGKQKLKKFGEDIVSIIFEYCEKNNLEKSETVSNLKPKKRKIKKGDSQKESFDLYKLGITIEEIAKQRNLAKTTIEGHLSFYIGTGDLDISSFVTIEKINLISEYFIKNQTTSISKVINEIGKKVTYSDIRFVLKYLEYKTLVEN